MKKFWNYIIPFWNIGYVINQGVDFENDEYGLGVVGKVFMTVSITGFWIIGLGYLIFEIL